MEQERDISILWWPIHLISAFRVHLILTTVIGAVWCVGWVRAMEAHWNGDHLMLPPLIEPRDRAVAADSGPDAAGPASSDTAEQRPAPHNVKRIARRPRSYGPMATLRDGID